MELLSAGSVGTEGRLRARTQRQNDMKMGWVNTLRMGQTYFLRKDFHKEEDSGWAVAENMRKEAHPAKRRLDKARGGSATLTPHIIRWGRLGGGGGRRLPQGEVPARGGGKGVRVTGIQRGRWAPGCHTKYCAQRESRASAVVRACCRVSSRPLRPQHNDHHGHVVHRLHGDGEVHQLVRRVVGRGAPEADLRAEGRGHNVPQAVGGEN
jgi:hypothetical protein